MAIDFQSFMMGIASGNGGGITPPIQNGHTATFKVGEDNYYISICQSSGSITAPVDPTITSGSFNGWKIGSTVVSFPYEPSGDVEIVADIIEPTPQPTQSFSFSSTDGTIVPGTENVQGTFDTPITLQVGKFYQMAFTVEGETDIAYGETIEFSDGVVGICIGMGRITSDGWLLENLAYEGEIYPIDFSFELIDFPSLADYDYYTRRDKKFVFGSGANNQIRGYIDNSLDLVLGKTYGITYQYFAVSNQVCFILENTEEVAATNQTVDGNTYVGLYIEGIGSILDKCDWEENGMGTVVAVSGTGTAFANPNVVDSQPTNFPSDYVVALAIKVGKPAPHTFVTPDDIEYSSGSRSFGNLDGTLGLVENGQYTITISAMGQTLTGNVSGESYGQGIIALEGSSSISYTYIYDNAYWDYEDLDQNNEPALKAAEGKYCFKVSSEFYSIPASFDVTDR